MSLSDQLDYRTRSIRGDIDKIDALVKEIINASTPGRFLPIIQYPSVSIYVKGFPSPEHALVKLEEIYKECQKYKEPNEKAAKNNIQVKAALVTILKNAGLQEEERVRNRKKRDGWDTSTAGWIQSLGRFGTTDGWAEVERSYKDKKREIDEWRNELNAQKEKARLVREAESKRSESERLCGAMATKYGLDLKSDWSEVMTKILEGNKYLRLAHFLSLNRGDWNDGYSYAREGIDGFTAETPDDHAIVNDITSYFEDFSDGRVFRDCTWNYDRLYELAQTQNESLCKDYYIALEHAS